MAAQPGLELGRVLFRRVAQLHHVLVAVKRVVVEVELGISAPYEAPEACEPVVDTAENGIEQSVQHLLDYVDQRFPI